MLKLCFGIVVILGLAGCMGSAPASQSAAALDVHSASCANPNLKTINNLPMRCGPQTAKPYTYQ